MKRFMSSESQYSGLSENTRKGRPAQYIDIQKNTRNRKLVVIETLSRSYFYCRMNIFQKSIYHDIRLGILHRMIYNTTYKFQKSKSFFLSTFQLSPEWCVKTAYCQKLAKTKLFLALTLADKLYTVG
jgi:hypothetical protein